MLQGGVWRAAPVSSSPGDSNQKPRLSPLNHGKWLLPSKGMTKDEMVGWHHRLDGHEFEQALGIGDGQGSLACCHPCGHKELDTTEWLNWLTDLQSAPESPPRTLTDLLNRKVWSEAQESVLFYDPAEPWTYIWETPEWVSISHLMYPPCSDKLLSRHLPGLQSKPQSLHS